MTDLTSWDDDDVSRLGAFVAELLDLGEEYGDLDSQLVARLILLEADVTRAMEERHGQQADATTTGLDAWNDAEVSAALLACAVIAGLDEAHSDVLDPGMVTRLTALMADILATQRYRRQQALHQRQASR
jgi:hypothetical protein